MSAGDIITYLTVAFFLYSKYKQAQHDYETFPKDTLAFARLLGVVTHVLDNPGRGSGIYLPDMTPLNDWLRECKDLLYGEILELPAQCFEDRVPPLDKPIHEYLWYNRQECESSHYQLGWPKWALKIFFLHRLRRFQRAMSIHLQMCAAMNGLQIQ